jgi:hypothetical protein
LRLRPVWIFLPASPRRWVVSSVEHEVAAAEIRRQGVEFARQLRQFVLAENADALQPLRMHEAGGDVVQEEFAVEDDVVAREEGLDLRIDGDAGFLPEQVGHVVSP